MTLRHAASRTGLSATTLRRYIKSGRLRARLIPGRYGPEYVVDDDDLRGADLLGQSGGAETVQLRTPTLVVARSEDGEDFARDADDADEPLTLSRADLVPGLLYRELLMKHEHLLVQYGMMRVSGQQLVEVRREAERQADDARRAAAELATIRDRHAREIGGLKARLRQAELEIAARDDENARIRSENRRLEIAVRNAAKANTIDEEFARQVRRGSIAPGVDN